MRGIKLPDDVVAIYSELRLTYYNAKPCSDGLSENEKVALMLTTLMPTADPT